MPTRGCPTAIQRAPPARYAFAGIEVDLSRRRVARHGTEVPLAPREFDLLVALLRRGGVVATRAELLSEVWDGRVSSRSRTLDKHIFKLRHKLEVNPAHPAIIRTVGGTGYRLDVEDPRGEGGP
ncbi:MAG: winged helix-turn-helix domain-containing protein [Gemmatimonadaceae bacterium]